MTAVIINGEHAATLTLDKKPVLAYEPSYQSADAIPLSINLPVGNTAFTGSPVRNWLLNLLPEDQDVIRFLRSEYDVPSVDPLHLLDTPIGLDCAGAVQFCPDDQLPSVLAQQGGEIPVSENEISEWLRQYPIRPLPPHGEYPDTGFSLAGMQPKVALRQGSDGAWSRPWGQLPTTHILKAARSDHFPDECVFEHIALSAAVRLGIAAPPTDVVDFDGMQILIVERYDRTSEGLHRIHQEDMCQVTGRHPNEKYEYDRGPSIADISRALRASRAGTADTSIDRFRDQLLYGWLIANNDGHAKNYSILHGAAGQYVLAPLYDACSWLPYRRNRPVSKIRMAMSMGSGFNLRTCDKFEMLEQFADRLGQSPEVVSARAVELSGSVAAATQDAISKLPSIPYDEEAVERHGQEIGIRGEQCRQIAETAHAQAVQARRNKRSAAQRKDASNRSARCKHVGVRSRKQCIRRPHTDKQHRYQ